jgi:alpha-1,3-rhamnosyl/mannosyltransferase
MRIVINQLTTLGRKTGVGHYTRELSRCLHVLAAEDEIDGFPTGWVRRACRAVSRARPLFGQDSTLGHAVGRRRGALTTLKSELLEHVRGKGRALVGRYFEATCRRARYDLYHEPNYIPFASDRPTVTTIHDLSILLHPEWHPADRARYYEVHFRRALAHSAHFLAVSEFGRQEIIRTLGIAPEQVTRTYNGVRATLRPVAPASVERTLRELGLPSRYLLYLGTIEPRKNILFLLHAYCSLPRALRECWPLVLVGAWGWNSADVAQYLHDVARHQGVFHLGYVREAQIAALYQGARALVYPSHYEGFGLPPLEMLAVGGAVLASTADAIAETVQGQAHLVPADDLDGWRGAMARVVQDDDWWQALRAGGPAVAASFTWERCALDTLGVYHRLCRPSGERSTSPARAGTPDRKAA